MNDNLTDQQRAEQVWGWLRENGWYLLGGIVLGLGGLFVWRQWGASQLDSAEQASALYAELLTSIRVERATRAEEIAAKLAADFSSTPYADQARLAMARVKMDRNQPDDAAKYLREAMDGAGGEEIRHIARLRLARVLAQQEKYDEALQVLVVPDGSSFAPRYHEVRGDVLVSMGRADEARTEYEAALTGADSAVIDQLYVQAKLDGLAGGAAQAAEDRVAEPPAN